MVVTATRVSGPRLRQFVKSGKVTFSATTPHRNIDTGMECLSVLQLSCSMGANYEGDIMRTLISLGNSGKYHSTGEIDAILPVQMPCSYFYDWRQHSSW